MKIPVMFKTPDAASDALANAKENLGKVSARDEKKFNALAKKFMQYGEYAVLEFDTDTGTATVLPTSRC